MRLESLYFREAGNEIVFGKIAVEFTRIDSGLNSEFIVLFNVGAKVYKPEENKKFRIDRKKLLPEKKMGIIFIGRTVEYLSYVPDKQQ